MANSSTLQSASIGVVDRLIADAEIDADVDVDADVDIDVDAGAGRLSAPADLYGFGGLHGGLVAAALTRFAARAADVAVPATADDDGEDATAATTPLRGLHAQFLAPITGPVDVVAEPLVIGRGLTSVMASARGSTGDTAAAVTATFGADRPAGPELLPVDPPADVGLPEAWDRFAIPVEFVPISQHVEIRPVGDARPYEGGADAHLTAWIRWVDLDRPPGPLDLVVLLDLLAPSYAAVLHDPRPVPTVGYTAQLTGAPASGPWVLLDAVTRTAGAGWVNETIDAWDRDGTLLASAQQLRVLR